VLLIAPVFHAFLGKAALAWPMEASNVKPRHRFDKRPSAFDMK
jgi:hypothetical protein